MEPARHSHHLHHREGRPCQMIYPHCPSHKSSVLTALDAVPGDVHGGGERGKRPVLHADRTTADRGSDLPRQQGHRADAACQAHGRDDPRAHLAPQGSEPAAADLLPRERRRHLSAHLSAGQYRPNRPGGEALIHAGFGPSGYSNDRPIRAVPSLERPRAHSNVFGGFARSIRRRSQSTPYASILAQWRGFRRIERSTRASSGGVGGRPRFGFGACMRRL